MNKILFKSISLAILAGFSLTSLATENSRLSDEVITPNYEDYSRTAPLFELGQPFLETGNIDPGFELSTGAVWQPQFMLFGDIRTAVQDYKNGATRNTEWANRLNLFGQLKLTGTERFLIGLRPLDKNNRFTGTATSPRNETINEVNLDVSTFYFEGELGEIFPNLDPTDTKKLDWGFAIGRQPLLVQEGLLINDTVDAIGIVRNSISLAGIPNLRITGMYGWNEINRDDNLDDNDAKLYGLFSELDTFCCTINIDFAYVDSDDNDSDDNKKGDGVYLGLSSVQRLGHYNTSVRLLHSKALNKENTAVSTGSLLFLESSYSPQSTHDNVYGNAFIGIDKFSSAARNDSAGGPLGRAGILYASADLGQYGSALGNRADDVVGFSVGYQKFMAGNREQLIAEFGAKQSSVNAKYNALAIGLRFQKAYGKHNIIVLDGFLSDSGLSGSGNGIRLELRSKF